MRCLHAHSQRLAHGGWICTDCGCDLGRHARPTHHKTRPAEETEALEEMDALLSWAGDDSPSTPASSHIGTMAEFWRTRQDHNVWPEFRS